MFLNASGRYHNARETNWKDAVYPPGPGEEGGPEDTHTCMYYRLSSPFLPSRESLTATVTAIDTVHGAFPIPIDRAEVLSPAEV